MPSTQGDSILRASSLRRLRRPLLILNVRRQEDKSECRFLAGCWSHPLGMTILGVRGAHEKVSIVPLRSIGQEHALIVPDEYVKRRK